VILVLGPQEAIMATSEMRSIFFMVVLTESPKVVVNIQFMGTIEILILHFSIHQHPSFRINSHYWTNIMC
jgi:hypothetical protein